MWAVWTHRRLTRSISAQQGMDLRSATDDLGKLHCFAAFVVSTTEAQNRKTYIRSEYRQMCEGSTSRIALRRFQLESLILAQNERWRQA